MELSFDQDSFMRPSHILSKVFNFDFEQLLHFYYSFFAILMQYLDILSAFPLPYARQTYVCHISLLMMNKS